MLSNSPTTACSPTSRCRDDASIMEAQRPSPLRCLHRPTSATQKKRNDDFCGCQSMPSFENDFPRLLFLDNNSTEDETDTFKIHRKLLRRRYVRREQNRKKRQRDLEKAKKLVLEAEKHQHKKVSDSTALQSTLTEDATEVTKEQQRLLRSPSISVPCEMGSPCISPGINLPGFSPLHPTKRRKTRATC